jgi:SAM-dependent methyltransferase
MSDDQRDGVDELLAAAYAGDGPDANRELYARWATTYESVFIRESGYIYHDEVAEVLAARWPAAPTADDVVVDVGCGTGLAGTALRARVDVAIDGVDISPEMLEHAASKVHDGHRVYRRLIEVDLTGPIDIADGTYAGVISVGTFTHCHVGPSALAEVVRVMRPGGVAALGVNAAHFDDTGFGDALDGLVRAGRIRDLEFVHVPIYADSDPEDPDRVGRVAVFRVN